MFAGTALVVMPMEWFLLAPFNRGWKPLHAQMADQVAQSAALARECAAMGALPGAVEANAGHRETATPGPGVRRCARG
jgi:hypothetical protein